MLILLIYPKLDSTTRVSKYMLPLIQLILDGYKIVYPSLIVHYMIECAKRDWHTPLPFGTC